MTSANTESVDQLDQEKPTLEAPRSSQSSLIDAVEFAENQEPRCPCVLLLDTSGSMAGQPIAALNAGLATFRDDLMQDPVAPKRVEVAVVAFDTTVRLVQDFVTPDRFEPPLLTAQGATHMGAAINTALDMVEQDINEVMFIRVVPPKASYWAVEFGSYWWETMDYRYRLCSLNQHHAVLEDDGSLLVVVSHEDPGVPNWLDPSGHEEGYVTFRWIGADHYPRPSVEQFSARDLETRLPAGVRRIKPEQRAEQLRRRRLGVIKRFGF